MTRDHIFVRKLVSLRWILRLCRPKTNLVTTQNRAWWKKRKPPMSLVSSFASSSSSSKFVHGQHSWPYRLLFIVHSHISFDIITITNSISFTGITISISTNYLARNPLMFAFNLKVFERVLAVFLLIQCWMLFFLFYFFSELRNQKSFTGDIW